MLNRVTSLWFLRGRPGPKFRLNSRRLGRVPKELRFAYKEPTSRIAESGPEKTLCINSELDGRAEFQVFDHGMTNDARKAEWRQVRKRIEKLMRADISEASRVVDNTQKVGLENGAIQLTKLRYDLLESASREDASFRREVVLAHQVEQDNLLLIVRVLAHSQKYSALLGILSDANLGLTLQERFLLHQRVCSGTRGRCEHEVADFAEVYSLAGNLSGGRRSLRTVQSLLADDGFDYTKRIIMRIKKQWPKVRDKYASQVNAFLGRAEPEPIQEDNFVVRRGGLMTGNPGRAALGLFRKVGIPLETARLCIGSLHRRNLNSA